MELTLVIVAAAVGYVCYRNGKQHGSRAAFRVGWRRGRRSARRKQ